MTNPVGAEIEALRSFAHQMDQRAADMRTRMTKITSRIEHLHWVGPDRERFLAEWKGSHVPTLSAMLGELADAAVHARRHADAQASASQV